MIASREKTKRTHTNHRAIIHKIVAFFVNEKNSKRKSFRAGNDNSPLYLNTKETTSTETSRATSST